jgi:cell division protein FtsI (penicillin-binding protein 3)
MNVRKDILWRVNLSFILILLLGLAILGRVAYIQTVEGGYWKARRDSMQLTYVSIPAQRGSIFSEDGNILSTSVPEYDVFIDFRPEGLRAQDGKRFKENLDSLSYSLSLLFKDSTNTTADWYKEQLMDAYTRKESRFVLKRRISFDQMLALRRFPLVRDGQNKSGFIFELRDRRINPYGLLANRTIGISRKDSTKNVGLEKTYDSILRGQSGQKLVRWVAGSRSTVDGSEVEPINGKDIITTLDIYMQDVAEQELMNMLVGNKSQHGTVIVMETATGKIKAIANLGKVSEGNYIEDMNYGIGKATEPGSVFKLATLLSLLDDGYVTNTSTVDCEGGAKSFYGLRIKDSHLGTGVITVKEAFLRSSNVAFAKLAFQYYGSQPMKWWQHLDRFRLNQMTGIDIVASSGKPTIKKPGDKSWGATTIPYMAHGYEELVTPLHMLMLYNAVANNGRMMKPYLVHAIREQGQTTQSFSPEVLVDKICSDKAIVQAKECLSAVVDSAHGTGHRILFDSAYRIAGKTGTAVSALDNKGYNKGNKIYQSSFIGYFPADNPKYSIAVVIQNNETSVKYYGADVAGTVFKKVSDKIYRRYIDGKKSEKSSVADSVIHDTYGMRSDLEKIFSVLNVKTTTSGSNTSTWVRSSIQSGRYATTDLNTDKKGLTPDVIGMGLKDAVYLLESRGFVVVAHGRGKVTSQSIAKGTPIIKGKQIILLLN